MYNTVNLNRRYYIRACVIVAPTYLHVSADGYYGTGDSSFPRRLFMRVVDDTMRAVFTTAAAIRGDRARQCDGNGFCIIAGLLHLTMIRIRAGTGNFTVQYHTTLAMEGRPGVIKLVNVSSSVFGNWCVQEPGHPRQSIASGSGPIILLAIPEGNGNPYCAVFDVKEGTSCIVQLGAKFRSDLAKLRSSEHATFSAVWVSTASASSSSAEGTYSVIVAE
ncbi:hypothetical protein BGY98DRAFT_930874 [Russula aff. rugulosa BPL654]|nr:hypothetical protein BGY98DRAFT_930874 [Russula aff. rugulosa BPL654]